MASKKLSERKAGASRTVLKKLMLVFLSLILFQTFLSAEKIVVVDLLPTKTLPGNPTLSQNQIIPGLDELYIMFPFLRKILPAEKFHTDSIGISADTSFGGRGWFPNFTLSARVVNDTIYLAAISNDGGTNSAYNVSGKFFAANSQSFFVFNDSVVLNHASWFIPVNNIMMHITGGLLVKDLSLSRDSSVISVSTNTDGLINELNINLQNFNINNLAGALKGDSTIAAGIINGALSFSGFNNKMPVVTGNATVNNFTLYRSPVGNINFNGQRQNKNVVIAVAVAGNTNDIALNYNYTIDSSTQQIAGLIDIRKLSLSNLQNVAKGYIINAIGNVHGSINLAGSFLDPQWKGYINFDTTSFSISQFGSTYDVINQRVDLRYPEIYFNKFTISDSLGNPLQVDGSICVNKYAPYDINLAINSKDFAIIKAPKAINNQLFGYAGINSKVSITGNGKAPVIKGDILLNNKSALTLIMPETNLDKDAARSIVRFIDVDTFALPERRVARRIQIRQPQNLVKFVNPDLHIIADKGSSLTLIIDPSTGDELKVQGEAKLNVGLDSLKNIVLKGTYKLDTGAYTLNYEFLKKQFLLQPGSVIDFNGNPADAIIDIKAVYMAVTPPAELLGNEVGSVDPKLAYTFKRVISFPVLLKMKGTLLSPQISFDILMPSGSEQINPKLRATINNKLLQLQQDVAATNKQVFALLVMGRFVGEQSIDFFKGSGSTDGFNDLATESVSSFLSAALDQIASDLFKGINLDLNVNTYKDFTASKGAQREDLSVKISSSFLNNRLNVTVGKYFGVDGQDGSAKAAKQKGSRFLPDVTVNYKLSQDGKYILRSYNKSQFEVIIDGYILETGIGFIVTLDYEKLSELLTRRKKQVE